MKPILIDCDDVCIDLLGAWLKYINNKYNLNYEPSDIKTWNIPHHIQEISQTEIFDVLKEEDFYDNIQPIEGSIEYVKKIIDMGYPYRIVTAHDYYSIKFKMVRFFKLFPFIPWDKVIVAKDKSLIDGSIMIDDKYDNLISNTLIDKKVLFKRHHNANYHMCDKMDHVSCSWHDIYRFIRYHYGDINE